MRLLALIILAGAGAAGAAETSSDEARREFGAGRLAAKQGQTAEALQRFQRAVEVDPSFPDAWFELGVMQVVAGQTDAARKSYESALLADPRFCDTYLNLADLARRAFDWRRVVDLTSRLIKADAVDYPEAYLDKATALYHLGDFAAAETVVRAGQRVDYGQKHPGFLRLLGLMSAARGDPETAEKQLSDYLTLAPSDPEAPATREVLDKVRAQREKIGRSESTGAAFRADTELALVRFQVSPKRGQFVTDLRPEDIEIREDGIPQRISVFEGGRFYPRVTPLEITLLFDCISSVQSTNNLNAYIFHENLLDEFENASIAIYAFTGDLFARMVSTTGPTRRPRVLKDAMDAVMTIRPGTTPFFWCDRQNRAPDLEQLRRSQDTGGDLRRHGFRADLKNTTEIQEAASVAQEGGMAIYPVRLVSTESIPSGGLTSVASFLELARATGGKELTASRTPDMLARVLRDMAARLQYDYVAGYYPTTRGQNKRHPVEVVLKSKDRGQIEGGKRIVVH